MTQEVDTGAASIVSVISGKCLDNHYYAPRQYSCVTGTAYSKGYYFEPQGYVTNCGGAASRKVRTLSLGQWSNPLTAPSFVLSWNAGPPFKAPQRLLNTCGKWHIDQGIVKRC